MEAGLGLGGREGGWGRGWWSLRSGGAEEEMALWGSRPGVLGFRETPPPPWGRREGWWSCGPPLPPPLPSTTSNVHLLEARRELFSRVVAVLLPLLRLVAVVLPAERVGEVLVLVVVVRGLVTLLRSAPAPGEHAVPPWRVPAEAVGVEGHQLVGLRGDHPGPRAQRPQLRGPEHVLHARTGSAVLREEAGHVVEGGDVVGGVGGLGGVGRGDVHPQVPRCLLSHLSDGLGAVLHGDVARAPAGSPQVKDVLQHEADAQRQLRGGAQPLDASKVLLHQVLSLGRVEDAAAGAYYLAQTLQILSQVCA